LYFIPTIYVTISLVIVTEMCAVIGDAEDARHFPEFVAETPHCEQLSRCLDTALISAALHYDYATVLLQLPGISNNLEVVRLL
jgi:hypothetical protein